MTMPSLAKKVEQATLDPHIAHLFPAGGQQGTTVSVMVSGQNLSNIKTIRITGKDITAKLLEHVTDASLRVTVKLGPTAKPGMHDFRVLAEDGISNRFRFFVDQYPEVTEKKPNAKTKSTMDLDLSQAQRLATLPVVVNGRIFGADRDLFSFDAHAGQVLVFDVQARAILPFVADAVPGWFQACITLYDSNGRVVVYADDNNFEPDPRLIHTFKVDGRYTVEIRDALYRGRADWVYRLRIGEIPTLTHVFPLGISRNEQQTFELNGVHLPTYKMSINDSGDPEKLKNLSVTDDQGHVSNSLPILVNDAPSVLETEPNNGNNQAQFIQWPVCIDGRIDKPGDMDFFALDVKKNNQKLLFNVYARRLNSPMDSFIDIINSKGKWLKGNDDQVDAALPMLTHHADSRLLSTLRKGRYIFRIRETQGKGGAAYAYRLVVSEPQQDFALRLMPINRSIMPGGTAELTAQVIRAPGFTAPVELTFGNLPQGITVRGGRIPKGQNIVRMTLTAPMTLEGSLISPTLTGTATLGKQTITRIAQPAQEVMQAFIYKHRPITQELLLAITPRQYYSLTLENPQLPLLEIPAGGQVQVTFNIQREGKTTRPIRLVGYNPPRGINIRPGIIKPNDTQGTVTIIANKVAKPGFEQNIIIHGEMKQGKKHRIDIPAPAISIIVIPADSK
ncbi:MAG: hypothetical protein JKX85_07850 [Phycisphaeraceae bacterium]|nr:hypothetical protein [Phycisphaeraceae bacterium]